MSERSVDPALLARRDWIATYSGRMFFPLAPRAEDVTIVDIAHALAQLCRFAGHTLRFYSVAQHSVLVSQACGEADALWGLLHDASEAYLNDVIRPVKRLEALAGYRTLERRVQDAVCRKFGLPLEEPPIVHAADALILKTEQRDLMAMPAGWHARDTMPWTIDPLGPREAERLFLRRFYALQLDRQADAAKEQP